MANADLTTAQGDPWLHLARYTRARIALGRTGGSVPTGPLLQFRLAHARARDAVHASWDRGALAAALEDAGIETFAAATGASDRTAYLVRPDLGRQLSAEARLALAEAAVAWGRRDLVILVSDGLSARAAARQAVPVLRALVPRLRAAGWTMFPILLVPFARVKLQDEVGELLGARHALILLGERPGLGSADSLGAYFTFAPRGDRTDADRNCISNIRPEGLPPEQAAEKLVALLLESARLGLSGVALKDMGAVLTGGA